MVTLYYRLAKFGARNAAEALTGVGAVYLRRDERGWVIEGSDYYF